LAASTLPAELKLIQSPMGPLYHSAPVHGSFRTKDKGKAEPSWTACGVMDSLQLCPLARVGAIAPH